MGYLIFRGVSTANLPHVAVAKMPSHKKASKRLTEYYIKGRDGALHVDEGFANFNITVQLVLIDATPSTRQLVNAWADGTGKLISSDDLTKAYKATVEQGIVWERVKGNTGFYDTATIIFNCQPFIYEATESSYVFTSSGTLVNPGTDETYPTIVVEGSGDVTFSVAGQSVTIGNMSSGTSVTLDCENGYVYTPSGALTMVGDFPVIPIGTSSVNIGNATKLTITPHWRWV